MTPKQANSARSLLYVPADRPDRLSKVLERGADAVIVDLEDAVPEARKDAALETLIDWLPDEPRAQLWVRVNSGSRREQELAALVPQASITGIVLPKVENPAMVVAAADVVAASGSACQLAAVIESAAAVLLAHEIALGPRLRHIQLGEADLRADLRLPMDADDAALQPARLAIVYAAAAAGISPPVAATALDFRDLGALRDSTLRAKRLGFAGRTCIHPAQVPVVNDVFTPSESEIAAAHEIIESHDSSDGAAATAPDGSMIDLAVVRAARLTLELAAAAGQPTS